MAGSGSVIPGFRPHPMKAGPIDYPKFGRRLADTFPSKALHSVIPLATCHALIHLPYLSISLSDFYRSRRHGLRNKTLQLTDLNSPVSSGRQSCAALM
jgi:hypothetical protein